MLARTATLATCLLLAGCERAPHTGAGSERAPHMGASNETADRSAAITAFEARVVRVYDGDSFDVRRLDTSRELIHIRLAAIDAPERQQPFAEAAREHLRALIAERSVRVHALTHDHFGRTVAQITVGSRPARDVGLAQLTAGMAWYFRHYQRDLPPRWRPRYDAAQRQAQAQRRGLWRDCAARDCAAIAPWRYRAEGAASGPAAAR